MCEFSLLQFIQIERFLFVSSIHIEHFYIHIQHTHVHILTWRKSQIVLNNGLKMIYFAVCALGSFFRRCRRFFSSHIEKKKCKIEMKKYRCVYFVFGAYWNISCTLLAVVAQIKLLMVGMELTFHIEQNTANTSRC